MKTATKRLVRPEFMNHHQTLFAGDIIKWMTEAGFIGVAETLGRTDHVVLTASTDIAIRKPVQGGTIIEMQYEAVHFGTTSIVIQVEGVNALTHEKHCEGRFVFVTIDDAGKKTPHGLGTYNR